MIKHKVLVVEDDMNISNFISSVLSANNYEPLIAHTGQQAYALATSACPDVILLNMGLPDMDGMDVIRFVRQWSSIPIIVVSARIKERDKVDALDAGADDYITKPFGTSELLARIRTVLRRSAFASLEKADVNSPYFSCGDFFLDYNKHQAKIGNINVHLTQSEYRIVSLLCRNAGRVLTYDYIAKQIWGPRVSEDNQKLRVNMANIRRKIEKNPAVPEYISTEVGVGYIMKESD